MSSPPVAFNLLAYPRMALCNPLSTATVDRVLAAADLRPGEAAVELGAGNGVLARHLARSLGLAVTAVERDPDLAALCRATFAEGCGPGTCLGRTGDGLGWLERLAPVRLLSVVGATAAAGAAATLEDTLARLKSHVVSGGWLLWGDAFWTREPSPGFRQAMEMTARFETFEGVVRAGQSAGLEARFAAQSPPADWEDAIWTMSNAVDDHLRDRPDAPEGPALRRRQTLMRDGWLMEGRDVMGFGLWLFRRP